MVKNFHFSISAKSVLGSTQPPIQCVPWALSAGIKRPERKADHSPPTSVEAKNGGSIQPLSHTSSWRRDYLIRHRDNLPLPRRKYPSIYKYFSFVCVWGGEYGGVLDRRHRSSRRNYSVHFLSLSLSLYYGLGADSS
jgi:hypothetical protein